MDIQTLCTRIELPEPMAQRVLTELSQLELEKYRLPMEWMMSRDTGARGYQELTSLLGDDPDGGKLLACQLHCACLRYDDYIRFGIPEGVYYDTMLCFSRFVTECLYYKGGYQFDRGWWTWRQLSMCLFRLGQLEYELRPDGTVGIHIPTGADLSPDSVSASLKEAKAFLTAHFPEYADAALTCGSWLLSPALKELLNETSNILHFQKCFDIERVDADAMEYVCWLFQRQPDADPETFPEVTSLQRRAKQYILGGGKIGSATGTII